MVEVCVTVECCVLYTCCVGCLRLCNEEGSSPVYLQLLSMCVLAFGMGTMLANYHMCGIMLVLREVFNMLVRNARPRGPMCLMFNLSGPCELLFLLCLLPLGPELW